MQSWSGVVLEWGFGLDSEVKSIYKRVCPAVVFQKENQSVASVCKGNPKKTVFLPEDTCFWIQVEVDLRCI